jgi:hypothetical protein
MLMRYVIATTEGYGLAQTKGNSQFLALAYDHIYELDVNSSIYATSINLFV